MNLFFRSPAMGLIAEKTGLLKIGRDQYTDDELIKKHPSSISKYHSGFVSIYKNEQGLKSLCHISCAISHK